MPNANPLKPSWNAGELSPRLAARTDLDKYANGASVLENMIPLAEGGAMRRAGTRFVAGAKDGTATTKVKPFKFSTTQAYILEASDNYFRFYRNQGRITAGATDASVTNGTFASDISGWTDASTNGTLAYSSSDSAMSFTLSSSSDTAKAEQTITISSSVIANEHILQYHIDGQAGDEIRVAIGATSSQTNILSAVDKNVGYHATPFTPNSTSFSLQFSYRGSIKAIDVPSSGSWSVEATLDDVAIISNNILELGTPWGSSQLQEVVGPQSADVLYLLHNNTAPYKLQRQGHTDWSLVKVAWTDGPYLDTNTSTTTLTANSTDGRAVTITASAITGINGGTGFGSSDIGRHIRLSNPSTGTENWGYGVIIGSTSTTAVTVDVKRDFPGTNATTEWRLGSWSDETGWPGVGVFHEQRLVLARSNDEPQTKWYSQTGDFENFTPDSASSSDSSAFIGTVEDDDGLNFTISSDDVEAIEWMVAGTALRIGTRNAEWEATSNGAVITPTDIKIVRHTQQGSARIQPVQAGHATIYVQRAKRRLRELVFSFEVDGLVSQDLTRLSPHITVGGLNELAYQQEPDSLVWATRNDGQLVSMTYRREEDVVAFSRHILGGSYGSGDAVVESIATIPGSTASGQTQDSDDRDELWMVVKRTINGSTVRYIEFLERDYEDGDSQEDSYYVDSCLTYDSASATSITGSSHLAAATAKVLANGAVHPDVTVSSSGAITLDIASSTVQIGLGFTHRMHTFKLEAGASRGTAQGQQKRIRDVTAVLLNSHTLKIGPSSSQLDTYDFREVSDAMDTAVPFFTGEKKIGFDKGWASDPRIVIEDNSPTPFTLLGLIPETKTNDSK